MGVYSLFNKVCDTNIKIGYGYKQDTESELNVKLHKILQLGEALRTSDELPRVSRFYLEENYPWRADSLCYIVEFEDEELETEIEFDFMNQYGVQRVEQTTEVDGLVGFALNQIPDATDEMLVESFNYYWRYNALLIFDED